MITLSRRQILLHKKRQSTLRLQCIRQKKKKIFTHLVSFVLLDEKNAIVYLKAFDNKQCSHKARVMLEVLNVLSLQMRERLFCIITE